MPSARAAFRRVSVPGPLRQAHRSETFIAPTRGWVADENLAASKKAGAFRLENWFPEAKSVRLRGGSELFATLDGAVTALFNYRSATEKFFAATASKIFDITTPASPSIAPTPSVISQTSGDYSTTQFSTAGGDFLYAVNGTDSARLYDGTRFRIVNAASIRSLAFDGQTGNFTVGQVVTGGTSGATGTIIEQDDAGATGTLYLQSVTGAFQDNETITDPIAGSALANGADASYSTIAITNVTTSTLSQVSVYRSRLYFVKKDTLSIWYLPVDVLGGAAVEFTLRGVFQRSTKLLFMATWSMDAGDGADDVAVFVSTDGEVAAYEGANPGDASWRLIGRFDIAKPLGKNATMRAGGDLLIATEEGIVPLSAVLEKDPAALSLAAVTRQIEPEWKHEVLTRGSSLPWQLLKWPRYNMMLVALPTQGSLSPYCIVLNIETGAPAKYTGWDTRCLGLFGEWAYFGTSAGKVMKCETGGSDNGTPYNCVMVGLFDHLKSIGANKTVHQARAIFKASRDFNAKVSVSTNYVVSLPSAPSAAADALTGSEWDTGTWDSAIWDASGEKTVRTKWVSIGRSGFVVAPQAQVTVGNALTPDAELIALELTYEPGATVV